MGVGDDGTRIPSPAERTGVVVRIDRCFHRIEFA
jgi:hypothetical protein